MRPTLAFVLCLSVSACTAGGDDDDDIVVNPDAAAADDPDATGAAGNALGETCTTADPCPTSTAHTCVFLTSGNPDIGYCSPVCADDIDCTTGYDGPGDPTCFTPADDTACSILCNTNVDCPTGLECFITGGPVNVCTTS